MQDPNRYINQLKDQFPTLYQENHNEHPIHLAYILINEDVRVNGTVWKKCMDCGNPYVIGENTGIYFCSDVCEAATLAYMNSPETAL